MSHKDSLWLLKALVKNYFVIIPGWDNKNKKTFVTHFISLRRNHPVVFSTEFPVLTNRSFFLCIYCIYTMCVNKMCLNSMCVLVNKMSFKLTKPKAVQHKWNFEAFLPARHGRIIFVTGQRNLNKYFPQTLQLSILMDVFQN